MSVFRGHCSRTLAQHNLQSFCRPIVCSKLKNCRVLSISRPRLEVGELSRVRLDVATCSRSRRRDVELQDEESDEKLL